MQLHAEHAIQPPAPPAPPAAPAPNIEVVIGPEGATGMVGLPPELQGRPPREVYEALRAHRDELRNQLHRLEERREELRDLRRHDLEQGNRPGMAGLDARIADVDQRALALEQQIASVDAQIARTTAIPGAVPPPAPPPFHHGPPEEVVAMGIIFMLVVLLPLSIAIARRIWRKGSPTVAQLPADLGERLHRLEQNVDTIAVEVERISEGQRFMTRVLAQGNGARVAPEAAHQG